MGFGFEGERAEKKREGRKWDWNEIMREREKKNQPIICIYIYIYIIWFLKK